MSGCIDGKRETDRFLFGTIREFEASEEEERERSGLRNVEEISHTIERVPVNIHGGVE